MKALVIGAGGVGRAIANIASRRSFIESMVIADRTLARAEEAVARVKDPRFSAAMVNAAELEDVRELIRKADPDVVINAVDPRFVMPIFLACEIENDGAKSYPSTLRLEPSKIVHESIRLNKCSLAYFAKISLIPGSTPIPIRA